MRKIELHVLSTSQVADLLGVSKDKVRKLRHAGLPHHRVRSASRQKWEYIHYREEVQRWLEKNPEATGPKKHVSHMRWVAIDRFIAKLEALGVDSIQRRQLRRDLREFLGAMDPERGAAC